MRRRVNDRDLVEVSYDSLKNSGRVLEKNLPRDLDVDFEVVLSKHAERKATPVFSGVLKYFPNAIKYVSKVSKAGNDQHHPDKPLHWDKSKSTDEPDALVRHLIDHSIEPVDDDGMLHLGKVAWRALAMLERYLDENPQ